MCWLVAADRVNQHLPWRRGSSKIKSSQGHSGFGKAMSRDSASLIEAWFERHDGDGEFARHGRMLPYTFVAPASDASTIVYTTKPAAVLAAVGDKLPPPLGIVGRRGLPGASDPAWIRCLVGEGELRFLGDLDPVDLMVFAWLRWRLHPTPVAYLGVGDACLPRSRNICPRRITFPARPRSENRSIY